jgi:hypothetical protein
MAVGNGVERAGINDGFHRDAGPMAGVSEPRILAGWSCVSKSGRAAPKQPISDLAGFLVAMHRPVRWQSG